tara:strand:- start:1445 stop:1681 length:237 start_codon:yes stop_codon:yes gene_type:complete
MNDFIMYDEEIVKNLKRIKELLLDKKTTTRFDHVRGNVENKEIMVESIDRAIKIIEDKNEDDNNPFANDMNPYRFNDL